MDKSLLHLSADICGLFLVTAVTLAANPATAEPNPVTSPASAKVPSLPEPSAPNATIVAPIQSPTTPTAQVNIVKSKSPPQNSLPQNSPPQNSPPQNSPPVAIDPATVNGIPTAIVPGATSTVPLQPALSSELPSPKLQSGQVNVGNYLFAPTRSIATPTISVAASHDSSNPTTLSSEAAQKTTSAALPIEARLNAAQQAYDRAAVKLAELRQASTSGMNHSPELMAAQQAEQIAAATLSQVQSEARQMMGSLKSRR
jgi:hypothetical protein